MRRLVVRRLIFTPPTIFLITLFVFSLAFLTPGDPAAFLLGQEGTPEQLQAFREELGLNRPVVIQYADWVAHVFQGDLGRSIRTGAQVTTELKNRYEVTLQLGLSSLFVSLLIALPVGMYSAVRPHSIGDNVGTVFAIGGVAVPTFWSGVILIYIFAVILGWLPAQGYVEPWEDPWGNLRHMILPTLVAGTNLAAAVTRQTRSAMLEVLAQDYIRTAHAKGLAEYVVVLRHALKNGLIPVITQIGIQVIGILGGFTVVETIFGLPGLGQFAVGAARHTDLPAIQGAVLAFSAIVLATNLIVDILYGFLDPRVRYT